LHSQQDKYDGGQQTLKRDRREMEGGSSKYHSLFKLLPIQAETAVTVVVGAVSFLL
jgi:hypothetical protein